MDRKLSILLCLSMALTLAGCAAEEEAPLMDPTVTVEVAEVQSGSLSNDGTYIGTISAEGTASVIPLVSGTVEKIAVSVGDTVNVGDLLCRFDNESARIALESAQAAYQSALTGVSSAEAAVSSAQESYQSALAGYGGTGDGSLTVLEEQVRLAQDNYEDTQALFEIGAASQVEVDQAYQTLLSAQAGLESAQAALSAAEAGVQQAQAGVESAQAGVASAQVGVSSAEYQLSLYDLTTPISGVVEAVNVTENNFSASGTVAFVISNGNNKTVTFYVTDQVRQTLTPGQEVTVTSDGMVYQGAITEISGVVDASTGLFQVKAVIDAQDLPDGLAVELSTTAYVVEDAVLVPSDALYFEDGDAYVFLLRDGTAVRVPVTIGLYTTDTIAITQGLTPGDQVITSWSASLKDGAPVRVAGESSGETDTGTDSGAEEQ
ncbi:efflux RND transporter periplasmic adaptor subunit [uncultured Intestinimonas sp.]|uniref:efflux RND transporter periplasmic adaptor subunit n=1 Tax=uncultured Intestinimonas sp. TaxID=1689265 RepID=UPI0025F8E6B4|nr:efflux RND transporter periplasmic adaptor subunit [uncultured Intestinimonas sp.]